MSIHEQHQLRSLALHAAVAQRLVAQPELIAVAQRRVASWLQDGSVARPYAESWSALLARPVRELVDALAERSERMHDLRQVSPFAGALDPRERWRILAETRR